MELAYNSDPEFVLVFEKGEHYMETLKEFLDEREIDSAFFHGLGGFLKAELAYYDLEKQEYIPKQFDDGPYEVASLIGNVSNRGEEVVVHNHVVLGDSDFSTIAGHLNEGVVGGTLEVHLNVLENAEILRRVKDEETGLDLIKRGE